jgi:hypothetical protein
MVSLSLRERVGVRGNKPSESQTTGVLQLALYFACFSDGKAALGEGALRCLAHGGQKANTGAARRAQMHTSGDLLDLKRRFLAQAHGDFQLAGVALWTQSQFAFANAGSSNAASMVMMAITTRSSTNVNPCCLSRLLPLSQSQIIGAKTSTAGQLPQNPYFSGGTGLGGLSPETPARRDGNSFGSEPERTRVRTNGVLSFQFLVLTSG